MNHKTNGSLDDSSLDRLVDGELSAAEYGELVSALDTAPDGWKRCALAFLEAQAWGGEMRAVRADLDRPPRLPSEPTTETTWRRPTWNGYLAMAASLLMAFGLGYALPGRPAGWTGTRADLHFAAKSPPPPTAPANSPRSDLTVMVGSDASGAGRHLNLPLYELDNESARWLHGDSAWPQEVHDSFRRFGDVERESYLAPVLLRDGRRVLVPVERVEVTPGPRRFQ